jgi:hypothetical protein
MASLKIGSGSTPTGNTAWQPYAGGSANGVYVDVNTSAAGFTAVPLYLTSIGGNSSHWATTGATAIYSATATGFRIYIRWADGSPLTPAQANSFLWHINWMGIES